MDILYCEKVYMDFKMCYIKIDLSSILFSVSLLKYLQMYSGRFNTSKGPLLGTKCKAEGRKAKDQEE